MRLRRTEQNRIEALLSAIIEIRIDLIVGQLSYDRPRRVGMDQERPISGIDEIALAGMCRERELRRRRGRCLLLAGNGATRRLATATCTGKRALPKNAEHDQSATTVKVFGIHYSPVRLSIAAP